MQMTHQGTYPAAHLRRVAHAPSSISREIRNAIAVATVPYDAAAAGRQASGSSCAVGVEVLTAMLNRIPEPSFEKPRPGHMLPPSTEGRARVFDPDNHC